MASRKAVNTDLFRALWERRDMTVQQIAALTGIGLSKARALAIDMALPPHPPGPPAKVFSDEQGALFDRLYEAGTIVADMADLFRISAPQVSRRAYARGLTPRRPRKARI